MENSPIALKRQGLLFIDGLLNALHQRQHALALLQNVRRGRASRAKHFHAPSHFVELLYPSGPKELGLGEFFALRGRRRMPRQAFRDLARKIVQSGRGADGLHGETPALGPQVANIQVGAIEGELGVALVKELANRERRLRCGRSHEGMPAPPPQKEVDVLLSAPSLGGEQPESESDADQGENENKHAGLKKLSLPGGGAGKRKIVACMAGFRRLGNALGLSTALPGGSVAGLRKKSAI